MRVSLLGFVAAASLLSAAARGEPSRALSARLACDPARAPGRVVCAVEVTAPAEQRLAWADALVLSSPAFARPLRARVTARLDGAASVRLPLALVLEAPGRGLVRIRARAVVCSLGGTRERCSPATEDAELELVVR